MDPKCPINSSALFVCLLHPRAKARGYTPKPLCGKITLSRVMHNFNSLRRAVLKTRSHKLKLWITLKNTLEMYADLADVRGGEQKKHPKAR